MVKNTETIKNQYKHIDTFCLILLPFTAVILTLLFPINLMVSTALYFGLPSLYLSWRQKDIINRSFIYATTITVISLLTDYLAERDNSWVSTSMFRMRLAGSVPLEALVWMFLFTYLIVAYYQFFYDHTPHASVGKRMPYVFLFALVILVWFVLTATGLMQPITVEYFYIKFGLAFIVIPLLAFIVSFPRYIRIFLETAPYFIALGFTNILVSLHKGHWSYPGHHFIGWVQFGTYRFPLEELLFWIILYSSFMISQFELFNNDHLDLKSSLLVRSKKI